MKYLTMVEDLLRDRHALYRQAREGKHLHALSLRLLILFLLSSAIYGGVMGAYRTLHPEFYFSDFELTTTDGAPITGEVAGMTADRGIVYTRTALPKTVTNASVRFNLTNPSDAYPVRAVGEEKGYHKIVLAPDAVLLEPDRWTLPALVALKIPLLFLLTLAVCAFALYILNLAFGMQLRFLPSMTLILFALAGTGVMLVVFAPIALLFTVVTASYHFMKIMHVLIFIVAGLFGVKILGEGLMGMLTPTEDAGQREAHRGNARLVLCSWLILYCLVGAQLSWTLKPFLGTPYLPATPPFRIEKGNIFVSTLESYRGIKPAERGADGGE